MKSYSPFQRIHTDRNFAIDGLVNSFNYDYPFPNAERLEKEERLNLLEYYYTKWAVFVLIGIGLGIVILVVTLATEELVYWKIHFFVEYRPKCMFKPKIASFRYVSLVASEPYHAIPAYLLFTVVFSIISAIPVIFWRPAVQGPGVPETISFLNGVDIPGFETGQYILANMISVLFMIFAGLKGGQMEAILPVGLVLASSLCRLKVRNFRFFPNLRYDSDRRDMGAVGLGAAASATFGTPLGGMFFVIQQLSKWHQGIPVQILVGSLLSSYIFVLIHDAVREGVHLYHNINSLFAPFKDPKQAEFALYEFPTFILFGVIGGLISALWIAVFCHISRLRVRIVRNRWQKLAEVAVMSIVIAVPCLCLVYLYPNCAVKESTNDFQAKILNELQKSPCTGDKFDTSLMFLLPNTETILRTVLVLKEDAMSPLYTFYALLLVFFVSVVFLGTSTTNGVILPHLIMGALWGRLFQLTVAKHLFIPPEINITKYALLGAAAQIGGVTQYSLAFAAMIAETVGIINFALPVFLVIFVARFVARMFVEGIYEILIYIKGYPKLFGTPPLCVDLTAKKLMAKRLVCLPLILDVDGVKNVLKSYTHMEFPVLDIEGVSDTQSGEPVGSCKGVILRKQLIPLLKGRRRESVVLSLPSKTFCRMLSEGNIQAKAQAEYDLPGTHIVNIERYMNNAPFLVHENMNFSRLFMLFEAMTLHTVLVVNGTNQLIGVITRKDFASIYVFSELFRSKIIFHGFVKPAENKEEQNERRSRSFRPSPVKSLTNVAPPT